MKRFGVISIVILICAYISLSAQDVKVAAYPAIDVDSIVARMIELAPQYEKSVATFQAELYLKSELSVPKHNILLRFLPHFFPLRSGINDYFMESYGDLKYIAPRSYATHITSEFGSPRGLDYQTSLSEYYHARVYAPSLQFNHLLSPLYKKARSYYSYRLDSVIHGQKDTLYYKITFIPKYNHDELVRGYMLVSNKTWTVREMYYKGRNYWQTFDNLITMGRENTDERLLPVRYKLNTRLNFFLNEIKGSTTYSLNYKQINLPQSSLLLFDSTKIHADSLCIAAKRVEPLTYAEDSIYKVYYRMDERVGKTRHKRKLLTGGWGNFLLFEQKNELSQIGDVRYLSVAKPLEVAYSGTNGLTFKQNLKFSRVFPNEHVILFAPNWGYNFTKKELHLTFDVDYDYWPQKRASFNLSFGQGDLVYSHDVLDSIETRPDIQDIDFKRVHLDYFRNRFFVLKHTIEISNGLQCMVALSYHNRKAITRVDYSDEELSAADREALHNYLSKKFISFSPRIVLSWTPHQLYYKQGLRKINVTSNYPTFSVDFEEGLKHIFGSDEHYTRLEFDVQQLFRFPLMRSFYYRIGYGLFANRDNISFVDFKNLTPSAPTDNWSDELGGIFQLIDGTYFRTQPNYLHGHLIFETPFLLLNHLFPHFSLCKKERLYFNTFHVPEYPPYYELGYGIATPFIDCAVFAGYVHGEKIHAAVRFSIQLFSH